MSGLAQLRSMGAIGGEDLSLRTFSVSDHAMTEFQPILLDLPLPIVTPRLLIRPTMPGDGRATHEAMAETFDQLKQWMPWTSKNIEPPETTEANIRIAYSQFIQRQDFRMNGFEREGGRPVVFTGLHGPKWNIRSFEIGYWVRKSAQGNGYAAEATNALARYAFDVLEARRVEISHAEGNLASRAIIRKLGFEHECTKRLAHVLPDGSLVDDERYVLLSPNSLPHLEVAWG